jgi:GTP cyclohydrolase II
VRYLSSLYQAIRLGRSAWSERRLSLTGREVEASPPWRAISILGVALMNRSNRIDHIRLTSHPDPNAKVRFPIHWGAASAYERGPIIGTVSRPQDRNVIGSHGGSYALYRALAVSSGTLDPIRRPDLTNTYPAAKIGPFPQWMEPRRIVSLDPWGHLVAEIFQSEIADGLDLRPSIAVTRARLDLPEIRVALSAGRLHADGRVVHQNGGVSAIKIAIDPVWYLPGEIEKLDDPRIQITCRVHDECNGSDVFGSDICTCRPYLIHGVEECARTAQLGGLGVIAYNRKEGRALGEVTKFLVYNARKRQEGGDTAAAYFERTECVAGVQDARFQQLMPDVIHWLGLRRIDRFVSMSDMKYHSLVSQGVEIVERIPIPNELVPADAQIEIAAKKAAGYFTPDGVPPDQALTRAVGRPFDKSDR